MARWERSRGSVRGASRRISLARLLSRPMIPREHGAWPMLFVPFAVAVGVAGRLDLKVLLFLLATFSFYVTRAPLERLLRSRAPSGNTGEAQRWLSIYLALGFLSSASLLFYWRLWWLVPFGALLLGFLIMQLYLTREGAHRSLWGRFLGVAGLTAAAPAAYYVADGALDSTAFLLWLLSILFFGGSLFYVRLRVQQSAGKGKERSLGRVVIVYFLASFALIAWLSYLRWLPLLALLAYIPSTVQTVKDLVKPEGKLSLRRIGFIQLSHSLIFALLLIGAYQVEGFIPIGR